jgi:4-hydroxy-2-oxoheptanedioate aldolase
MPRLNKFIERVAADEPAFSCVLPSGDSYSARRIGESELDMVMVDFEHEGFDLRVLGETLQWLISRRQMARLGDLRPSPTPIVRVPEARHDDWVVRQALDYGAMGIVLPRVQAAAQVEAAVQCARYPQGPAGSGPAGERGVWPGLAARYWGCGTFEEYLAKADLWPLNPDGELILIAMIEDTGGFDNIEEIVKVPGLGGVLFGPGDAVISLGLKWGEFHHPRVLEAAARVADACGRAGVIAGTAGVNDQEMYDAHRAMGYKYFLGPEADASNLMATVHRHA